MKTEPNEVRNRPKLVTVFGGSGFVGRAVVAALTKRGYRVRVAVRKPEIAYYMAPLGNVGQDPDGTGQCSPSRLRGTRGERLGSCRQSRRHSGRKRPPAFQCRSGAGRKTHCGSSQGRRHPHDACFPRSQPMWNSPSAYARTKAEGEIAVQSVLPDTVVLRPSIIFGHEDRFFNRFANMARFSPFLPVIGGGESKNSSLFMSAMLPKPWPVPSMASSCRAASTNWVARMCSRSRRLDAGHAHWVIGRKRMIVSMPLVGCPPAGFHPEPAAKSDADTGSGDTFEIRQCRLRTGDQGRPHASGHGHHTGNRRCHSARYLWRYRVAGQYTKTGCMSNRKREMSKGPKRPFLVPCRNFQPVSHERTAELHPR